MLCQDCIEESYRLLLCRFCGERALPLDEQQPATRQELHKARAVATPYTFRDALAFPFRGTGLYIFIVALFIEAGALYGGLRVGVFMSALIAALQFKIVRSTIQGENELPDWPDITAWSDLLPDYFAWLILEGSFKIMIALYFGIGLFAGTLGLEPSLPAALAFAALLWLGTGFQIIGYGVAASYSPWHLFFVHLHIKGYRQTFGDAIRYTNMVFALRGVLFLAQAVVSLVPILGGILVVALEAYFVFMVAHLSGLLFRKHEAYFDGMYLS